MATGTKRQQRGQAAKAGASGESAEGRTISLAKKAGVLVGLIASVLGVVFLLFPQLKPERSGPPANQSAAVTGIVVNPRTTRGQFLDYSDQSKLGFTRAQLAELGASAFARVQIVGYRGHKLILERQVVDARTGNVVGETRDFTVVPPAETVNHRWWDWTPLRPGTGSYIMVIKVLDDQQHAAIACGQTPLFGGAAGSISAQPPHLCEGQ
jgi:hypothetical protein